MKRLVWALTIAVAVTGGFAPAVVAQDRTIGERVDDAALTAAVKTKLVADRAKNLIAVDVDTDEGVVYLRGTVPSARDKAEAERLARGTKGVREVRNELTVTGTVSETPREPGAAASPRTR